MKQRGFTLLEVMISLIIGAFILSGVMFTYVSMKITTKDTLEIGELQETGRLAMDILRKDIEQTGFWGSYLGKTLDVANITFDTGVTAPSNDCFAGNNNATFPVLGTLLPGTTTILSSNFKFIYGIENTTQGAEALGCIKASDKIVTQSDILQIKRFDGMDMTGQHTNANKYYFMSEYAKGTFFKGTGSNNITSTNLNATLWGYNHHVYYVNEQDYQVSGKTITVPVLMRKRLTLDGDNFATDNLMEGVEKIRFIYGIDMNGDNRVDTYKTAAQMSDTDWEQSMGAILTVQVFVLVRSLREDLDMPLETRTYKMGGGASYKSEITVTDKYRRALFVSTVKLANGGTDEWNM